MSNDQSWENSGSRWSNKCQVETRWSGKDVRMRPSAERKHPRSRGEDPMRTLTGRHEVSLVRRAAFTSREALLVPLDPLATYLPEVLEKLKRAPPG